MKNEKRTFVGVTCAKKPPKVRAETLEIEAPIGCAFVGEKIELKGTGERR